MKGAGVAGVVAAGSVVAPGLLSTASAASASTTTTLVGCNSSSMSTVDALTGRTAQAVRVYLKTGKAIPTTAAQAGLLPYYKAGQNVVWSFKPDTCPAGENIIGDLKKLCANIAALGYAHLTRFIIHHEPYPELSASQYRALYAKYAPTVRSAGIRCGVCYQTYPIYHKSLDYTTYSKGNESIIDFQGIDTYPVDTSKGLAADVLATISPLTTWAKDNGKPFLICEWGVGEAKVTDATTAGLAVNWADAFTGMGGDVQAVLFFSTSPSGDMGGHGGLMEVPYRHIYDVFTARSGGTV